MHVGKSPTCILHTGRVPQAGYLRLQRQLKARGCQLNSAVSVSSSVVGEFPIVRRATCCPLTLSCALELCNSQAYLLKVSFYIWVDLNCQCGTMNTVHSFGLRASLEQSFYIQQSISRDVWSHQLVERWTPDVCITMHRVPGSESPGSSRSVLDTRSLTGMACGWYGSNPGHGQVTSVDLADCFRL